VSPNVGPYKLSRYNVFADLGEEGAYAFNAVSGALVHFEPRMRDALLRCDFGQFSDTHMYHLIRARFVVEEQSDEFGELKLQHRLARYSGDRLALTVAPTLRCNMSCVYCYQADGTGSMSKATREALVDFVEKYPHSRPNVSITWYGGEPLLEFDAISLLTDRIREVCTRKGGSFDATLVTNGLLLTSATAQTLKSLGVKTVQVTLDGPRDVHDARRMTRNGAGTFDIIVENIRSVRDVINVLIRVNVDRHNAASVRDFFGIVEGLGLGGIPIYCAPVQVLSEVCEPITDLCLGEREFSELELQFLADMFSHGCQPAVYPRRMVVNCCAVSANAYVIDPEGHLYKCWNHIGQMQYRIGHVSSGITNIGRLVPWLTWDPFENETCQNCSVLPLCLGGCHEMSMRRGSPSCCKWKYNLRAVIHSIANEIRKRKSKV